MIREFLDSWALFHYSYVEGWLIAVLLSLIGVLVVARDQIFLGAAVSQASTVGIALALSIAGMVPPHDHEGAAPPGDSWLHSDAFQASMAVVFSVLAALVTGRGGRVRRESHEAITGWVFLMSASLSVLIVARSRHGLDEIHRVHSSSLIGATVLDVWVFGVFVALGVGVLAATHRRLLLFAMDPAMAAAVGMKNSRWAVFVSVWLGLAVGLSIRAAGMLYTFGALVLPALVAKHLCREVRSMFWWSPVLAFGTATVGFVLANHYDFPPAQMTVALLGALLAVAWLLNWVRGITWG